MGGRSLLFQGLPLFWSFSSKLSLKCIILKVLTAVDLPALQEGLLIGNLRGDAHLVNLTEVSGMGNDERKNNEYVKDLGTRFLDPKTLKIINRMEDLVRFCGRVHLSVDPDQFVNLKAWHPTLEDVFVNTIRYEHPGRYDTLTLAFRGERVAGWRWNPDSEILNESQVRLLYALVSSMRSLVLDGIVLRSFWKSYGNAANRPIKWKRHGILAGRGSSFPEAKQLEGLGISKGPSAEGVQTPQNAEVKKARFQLFHGVTVAESLALQAPANDWSGSPLN